MTSLSNHATLVGVGVGQHLNFRAQPKNEPHYSDDDALPDMFYLCISLQTAGTNIGHAGLARTSQEVRLGVSCKRFGP